MNPSQPIDMNGKEGVEYVSKNQEYMSTQKLKDHEKIEGK
jgi:phospholipase C